MRPKQQSAEGRAIKARPSRCRFVVAVAVLLVCLAASPVASAVQPEPVALTETNPLSSQAQPALSTEPLIIGRGDGAIATVVNPFGGRTSSPISSAVNPDNQVDIYDNGTCTGSPVASGIVDELEGAGIQVEVEADSSTTFSAVQIDPLDPGSPSVCSKPMTYWNSSDASELPSVEPPSKEPPANDPPTSQPPAPATPAERPAVAPLAPRLKTTPGGTANDNTPRITGSASEADSVKLFSNSSCSGAPLAVVPPALLASGVDLHVADNSTTDFTGIAVAGGKQSFCSPPATYIEDSTPPRTRITMGPGAKTRHRKVVFRFADTGGDPFGTSFACKVDRGKWKPCRSPFKLRRLSYSRHVIQVRGVDVIGNAEAKAAKRSFKVIH